MRNEAHVDDDRRRPLAETLGVKRARIDTFEEPHALVRREARIELSAADVDRDNLRRAALEQDVGEASGRGADVEADEARGIEPECVERGGKLYRTPVEFKDDAHLLRIIESLTPPRET